MDFRTVLLQFKVCFFFLFCESFKNLVCYFSTFYVLYIDSHIYVLYIDLWLFICFQPIDDDDDIPIDSYVNSITEATTHQPPHSTVAKQPFKINHVSVFNWLNSLDWLLLVTKFGNKWWTIMSIMFESRCIELKTLII